MILFICLTIYVTQILSPTVLNPLEPGEKGNVCPCFMNKADFFRLSRELMETSFHFQHLCVTAGIWQPVAITGNKQDAKYTALFVDCSSWFASFPLLPDITEFRSNDLA